MSVVGLLAGISGFVKVRYLQDKAVTDNFVFRLHYRFTSAFFFGCCVLITAFDLFGKPIECVTYPTHSRMDAINTYCWTTSTFSLVGNGTTKRRVEFSSPGVGPKQAGDGERYHSYYQWVPFALFLQGILFYLPHWIWKLNEGGRIANMTADSRGLKLGADDERKSRCQILSRYLIDTMNHYWHLFYIYIICELINFLNAVGNIYFINKLLGGAFLNYGAKLFQMTQTDQIDRSDVLITIFPRLTKCTFHEYGPSGTIVNIDALCVLPLNNVHEKIYIFLWFWLIILSVVSGLTLVYRMAMIISPIFRVFIMRRFGSATDDTAKIIVNRVPLADYFLFHLLGKNLNQVLSKSLTEQLAMHLSDKLVEYNERSHFLSRKFPDWMPGVNKRTPFTSDEYALPSHVNDVKSVPIELPTIA